MGFSDELLDHGQDVLEAQRAHPFVRELAEGSLDEAAFRYWVRQDYRYLLDYARAFAIAGARARDEETMTELTTIAHGTLDHEMDLHREFAAEYGISREELEATRKTPTCQAYTDFLGTLTDEEDDYFERSFDALGVTPGDRTDPERSAVTAAFEDLSTRAALEGGTRRRSWCSSPWSGSA